MTLRTVVLTGSLLLVLGVARAETKVYDVDSKNAEEIASALNGVVMAQCNAPGSNGNRCSVRLLPTGQIIIEAPPESQAQVAETLKAIATRDVEPTPRIKLSYWVISGATSGSGPTPNGLEPVFAQLKRLHGDLAFSVEESASLTTESGTKAYSTAGELEVVNTVWANGASLRAEVGLTYTKRPGRKCAEVGCQPFRQEIGLTVTIKRGEYLVLGERAFDDVDSRGTMFYVVHWAEAE